MGAMRTVPLPIRQVDDQSQAMKGYRTVPRLCNQWLLQTAETRGIVQASDYDDTGGIDGHRLAAAAAQVTLRYRAINVTWELGALANCQHHQTPPHYNRAIHQYPIIKHPPR